MVLKFEIWQMESAVETVTSWFLRILYWLLCENLLYVLALLQGISHREKDILDKTKSCSEHLSSWILFAKWKKQKTADFPKKEHNALVCSNAVAHSSEVSPPQMIKRLISTKKKSFC